MTYLLDVNLLMALLWETTTIDLLAGFPILHRMNVTVLDDGKISIPKELRDALASAPEPSWK